MSDSILLRVRFDGDIDDPLPMSDVAVAEKGCAVVFAEQLQDLLLADADAGGAWGWGDAYVVAVEPVELGEVSR